MRAPRRARARRSGARAPMAKPARGPCAGRAGGVKATEHAVADGDPLDLLAGRDHRADELVADREAGVDRDAAVVDVEIRAADTARVDADECLGVVLERGAPA